MRASAPKVAVVLTVVAAAVVLVGAYALSGSSGSDHRASVIEPDPRKATRDVPDAYERECQVDQESARPVSCTYGDPHGDVTIALVGDSKALQWVSALDAVAADRGWRVQTYTKSACSFTAATVTRSGEAYPSCTRWNAQVVKRLKADPPDLVLTSQGRLKALNRPDEVSSGASASAMIDGLRRRWSALRKAGMDVTVIRDNPEPTWDVRPIYRCVDKHRSDPEQCAFDREEGEGMGAGNAQLAAVAKVPGVTVIDLNDAICRAKVCPPVIDGVLVYRQGSHLTTTFIDTLTPRFEAQLVPLVTRRG